MALLDLADEGLSRESLSARAEVALLARILHREGYNDHLAGHITYRQPDGTLLASPLELAWNELRASDIVRIDMSGNVIEGRWRVSPAIALHVELYKLRPEVVVTVHHHPEFATVWAAVGEKPPIYDQGSAIEHDDGVTVYADFEGDVLDSAIARKNVEAMGDAHTALLANHGVLVVADSIERVHLRSVTIEWRSRLAWRVQALGDGRGRPLGEAQAAGLAAAIDRAAGWPFLFEWAVRQELLVLKWVEVGGLSLDGWHDGSSRTAR
jgi:ribulose-5-phosphate 4-epimerase/fuculose-1-phosphate aldolase